MRITAVEILGWYDGVDMFWEIGDDGQTYLAYERGVKVPRQYDEWVAAHVDADNMELSRRGEYGMRRLLSESPRGGWGVFMSDAIVYPGDAFEIETRVGAISDNERYMLGDIEGVCGTLLACEIDVPEGFAKLQDPDFLDSKDIERMNAARA